MKLILLRHGIAEDRRVGLDDADRRLTPIGIERTRQAVRGLAMQYNGIDAVLTSPKRRALETAELLAEAVGRPVEVCEPLADGTLNQVLGALTQRDDSVPVLVGHEPQLSLLAEWLCSAGEAASFIELKKAGAIVLRVERLDRGAPSATLEALITPKALRSLATSE